MLVGAGGRDPNLGCAGALSRRILRPGPVHFGGARCDNLARLMAQRCAVSREWRNWQTRWLQVPVPARAWGFKSPLAHE